jgi:hypothetical protein
MDDVHVTPIWTVKDGAYRKPSAAIPTTLVGDDPCESTFAAKKRRGPGPAPLIKPASALRRV